MVTPQRSPPRQPHPKKKSVRFTEYQLFEKWRQDAIHRNNIRAANNLPLRILPPQRRPDNYNNDNNDGNNKMDDYIRCRTTITTYSDMESTDDASNYQDCVSTASQATGEFAQNDEGDVDTTTENDKNIETPVRKNDSDTVNAVDESNINFFSIPSMPPLPPLGNNEQTDAPPAAASARSARKQLSFPSESSAAAAPTSLPPTPLAWAEDVHSTKRTKLTPLITGTPDVVFVTGKDPGEPLPGETWKVGGEKKPKKNGWRCPSCSPPPAHGKWFSSKYEPFFPKVPIKPGSKIMCYDWGLPRAEWNLAVARNMVGTEASDEEVKKQVSKLSGHFTYQMEKLKKHFLDEEFNGICSRKFPTALKPQQNGGDRKKSV